MNRIRKMLTVTSAAVLMSLPLAAATPPANVIDMTSIINTIANGYKLYQQIQTTIQQLDTAKKQLQQQAEAFKNVKMDDLDATDPLKSWSSIMSYGDKLASLEDNLEATVNSKNMTIGSGPGATTFSLKDLFSEGFYEKLPTAFEDPTRLKTLDEKAAFHSQYGMSVEHYKKYAALVKALSDKGAEVYARTEAYQQATEKTPEERDKVLQTMKEHDSLSTKVDSVGAVLGSVGADIKALSVNALGLANLESTKTAFEISKDTADKEAWNAQNPTISSMWYESKEEAEGKYRSLGTLK